MNNFIHISMTSAFFQNDYISILSILFDEIEPNRQHVSQNLINLDDYLFIENQTYHSIFRVCKYVVRKCRLSKTNGDLLRQ